VERRWLRVGLLTLGIFAVNVIARVITKVADITEQSTQDTIAYLGLGTVCLVLAVAGAWWAVRYPFSRLFFDLAAVVVAFAFLAILVGPLLVGKSPFEAGLESVVTQILVFVGIGLVATLLGFAAMVTFGRDWKSRGLRRYEESYHRRPNRATRG
jgi:hypothetical protein